MVMSASSFSGFPADARILGLDIGSISVDVVLLDGLGTPLYSRYVRHHGQPDKVLCAELEALERTHAGIAAAVTGTGADRVGRLLGACAVNEVIAQVAAASFRCPQARSVIDIGGQDSKVINLDETGHVSGFMMNDKCAAGTGRFLEMMARTLELDMEEMSRRGLTWEKELTISSMCTVFAESEVISLIADNHTDSDIIHGLNQSIAGKTAAMAARAKGQPPYMMTGGVARNRGVVQALEEKLGAKLFISENPDLCGALGAALFALHGD